MPRWVLGQKPAGEQAKSPRALRGQMGTWMAMLVQEHGADMYRGPEGTPSVLGALGYLRAGLSPRAPMPHTRPSTPRLHGAGTGWEPQALILAELPIPGLAAGEGWSAVMGPSDSAA